jgi:hypothetical protein
MTKCLCPDCGQEIKYITTPPRNGGNGITAVDIDEQEIITERGRSVRGFKLHRCPPVRNHCTMPGMTTDKCHAFNGGDCMNEIVCPKQK